MSAARPFSPLRDPFAFEAGWTNAIAALAGLLLLLINAAAHPARADVIVDPQTGFAIFGYDPVAYYIDRQAVPGSAVLEAQVDGYAWRFESEANRQLFLDEPQRFEPALGGYDALLLVQGQHQPGNPETFALVDGRLYFFRSSANRQKFLASGTDRLEAERLWQSK